VTWRGMLARKVNEKVGKWGCKLLDVKRMVCGIGAGLGIQL
jgi:hypothetical protein